jgi:hypothetical protein
MNEEWNYEYGNSQNDSSLYNNRNVNDYSNSNRNNTSNNNNNNSNSNNNNNNNNNSNNRNNSYNNDDFKDNNDYDNINNLNFHSKDKWRPDCHCKDKWRPDCRCKDKRRPDCRCKEYTDHCYYCDTEYESCYDYTNNCNSDYRYKDNSKCKEHKDNCKCKEHKDNCNCKEHKDNCKCKEHKDCPKGKEEKCKGLCSFIYVFNVGSQTVHPGEAVKFDNHEPHLTNGISFISPDSIILANEGVYSISFTITSITPLSTFAIELNNTEVFGSRYGSILGESITGSVTITIDKPEAPALIKLINTSAVLSSILFTGSTHTVNASITILKIS